MKLSTFYILVILVHLCFVFKYIQSAHKQPHVSFEEGEDYSKGPRDFVSTHEVFDNLGLGVISEKFADVVNMFDQTTMFLVELNSDEKFALLNRFVAIIKKSIVSVFYEVTNAKDAPAGRINYEDMRNLVDRIEVVVKKNLMADPKASDSVLAVFTDKIHLMFDGCKSLYKIACKNEIFVNWWMLSVVVPFISAFPNDFLNRGTFADLLEAPLSLRDTIEDALTHLMASDYGPILKMATNLAASYYSQLRAQQRESEL